jgi:hypothetical protein
MAAMGQCRKIRWHNAPHDHRSRKGMTFSGSYHLEENARGHREYRPPSWTFS